MDGTVIKLIEPVTAYERTFTEIVLREPRGALFMRLGQPRLPVTNFTAGSAYYVEREEVVREYLLALIVVEQGDNTVPYAEGILAKVSLTDALQLKEALFGFFDQAAQRIAARRQESSSSV